MFDVYFGGNLSSRAAMQEKIRTMKTSGSVIAEAQHSFQDWKDSKFVEEYSAAGGAKFLGDAFVISQSEQN
ncbi:hypothetical protein DMX10_17960 [Pseudomonas sp. 57B-090624]|nr:hypothetical protein DMX10_17960 [Pseudomonas sp. 57B-090624]